MDTPLSLVRLRWHAASLVLLVAVSDVLLYGHAWGIGCGLFTLLAAAITFFNQAGQRLAKRDLLVAALLIAAAAQTAIRTSFSNLVALAAVLSFIMLRPALSARGRWAGFPLIAGFCWLRFPSRLPVFVARMAKASAEARQASQAPPWRRICGSLLPALAVTFPFVLLVGAGNAVAGHELSTVFSALRFPDLGRVLFWCFSGLAAAALLDPGLAPARADRWARPVPFFAQESDTGTARSRTWIALGALNALMAWANGIDVKFLWAGSALPAGVSYAAYVHEGVAALSAAAIVGGILIALVFQQDPDVSEHRLTRILAIAWAVQLVGLLAGAARRVLLYIQAYDLTVERLSVFPFLLLVATGLVLVVWKIVDRRSLNWLLAANSLAVAALFYAIQFVDFRAIVANYDVAQWIKDPSHHFDPEYLTGLGPSAWPALKRLHPYHDGDAYLFIAMSNRHDPSWQSWQWQRARLENEMLSK